MKISTPLPCAVLKNVNVFSQSPKCRKMEGKILFYFESGRETIVLYGKIEKWKGKYCFIWHFSLCLGTQLLSLKMFKMYKEPIQELQFPFLKGSGLYSCAIWVHGLNIRPSPNFVGNWPEGLPYFEPCSTMKLRFNSVHIVYH